MTTTGATVAAASGPPTRGGRASSAPTARTTSYACAARCRRSTRWPARGAERLWELLHERGLRPRARRADRQPGRAEVRAGLKAIYLSGWQVAADANLAGHTYPDQSLYPANSVPAVVRRINNALLRADQIATAEGAPPAHDWLAPIVADAEAGFGGPLNAYELMKAMIAAGAAGRALGGPARLREEVRPPRRQGADPDRPAHPHAERGPARRRRRRRAVADRRPHRRAGRHAASPPTSTSATSRSSPASARPRASTGSATASSRASPAAWPTPRTPT